jgi:hypothetical protein
MILGDDRGYAQTVEHVAVNDAVAGSIPGNDSRCTNLCGLILIISGFIIQLNYPPLWRVVLQIKRALAI